MVSNEMSKDPFFIALRDKYRFEHPDFKGNLNTEDLLGLSLEQLDYIALKLNKAKDTHQESFIKVKSDKSTLLSGMLDVVLKIIDYKLEEANKAETKKKLEQRRKDLLEHTNELQSNALKNQFTNVDDALKHLVELEAQIEELSR